jgi:nucleotide-binding universal stress UspA family protein
MTGDPADAISRAAEAKDVDLIVVGSGDKGLIQRWFGRSVSEDLTRELPRPVLVVG